MNAKVNDILRLVSAGLFVVGGIFVVVFVLSHFFPDPPRWLAVFVAPLLIFLVLAAGVVFSNWGKKRLPGKTDADFIKELQEENLLSSASYSALRAFEVQETEDEGLHYFVGLSNGEVLYLNGQYLYEYLANPDTGQNRSFPCAEFTLCWHKEKDYTVGIICSGPVLELEVTAPEFDLGDLDNEEFLEDRIILKGNYEQIKAERMRNTAKSKS